MSILTSSRNINRIHQEGKINQNFLPQNKSIRKNQIKGYIFNVQFLKQTSYNSFQRMYTIVFSIISPTFLF